MNDAKKLCIAFAVFMLMGIVPCSTMESAMFILGALIMSVVWFGLAIYVIVKLWKLAFGK